MITKKQFKALNIILLYIAIGLFIIIGYPSNIDTVLQQNYIIDTIAYFFMTGLPIILLIKGKIDIFDPIVFISLIYITMFSIIPIIDIKIGEIMWFGQNLFEYGVKGTIIAIIGYSAFFIGYTIQINKNNKKKIENISENIYNENKITLIALRLWIVCFILSVIYIMFAGGKDIMYILSLGILGDVNSNMQTSTPLGVVSMFSYSLIPTCLIYINYSKSKLISIIIFTLTVIIQLARGFRFIMIILILSYIFLYYLKNGKRPSGKVIIGILITMVMVVSIMGYSRNSIRSGADINWAGFNLEEIYENIFGNFRIYHTYYGVVKAVPKMTPHMYGSQMIIYTIVMFIPRALWRNKPYPNGGEAIRLGVSEYAAAAGQAYPGLGEYYYEFGILGVIFFMWLLGYWMRKIKNKYILNKTDDFGLIKYSIIVPTTLQLLIRGYTPSNFYLIIFLIMPIAIIKRMTKLNNKESK